LRADGKNRRQDMSDVRKSERERRRDAREELGEGK